MSDSSSSEGDIERDFEELLAGISAKFFIVSKMNGKVLDVSKCKTTEGTRVIMYDRKDKNNANQLWYLNSDGEIRAAINGMTLFAEKEGEPLRTSTRSDPRSKWRIDGERIINGLGQCLDVRGASKYNKAELCAYRWKGDSNQKWKFQPV